MTKLQNLACCIGEHGYLSDDHKKLRLFTMDLLDVICVTILTVHFCVIADMQNACRLYAVSAPFELGIKRDSYKFSVNVNLHDNTLEV